MKLQNQNILIISNEAWGPVWYSKHNYAWQLAKNNNVVFINPPQKFSLFNLFTKNITTQKIKDGLTVLTYKNILPVKAAISRGLNEAYIFKQLYGFLKEQQMNDVIFWTFDPIRLATPEKLDPKKIILHAVDHYLFTYESETILAKKADLILCVSDIITKTYLAYNKNVHTIPHGIPDDEFLPAIPRKPGPLRGIFTGTLDLRIDYGYTSYILEKFPEIQFKFIGKIRIDNAFTKALRSGALKNAVYESEKPFTEIKYDIQKSDLCFLFKDNSVNGNNISSHKMLQYLAQGKPVFCSELLQHKEINDLLYMNNDRSVMEKLFRTFIEKGEEKGLAEKRIEHAREHAFTRILSKIEQLPV